MTTAPPILVTGATGYIGGRLVPRLLKARHRVRCLVRSPEKLAARPWIEDPGVEVLRVDLTEERELRKAMEGCKSAFYLVHSMLSAGAEYADSDRLLAESFARTAESAGLHRIVYLSGLGETHDHLSEHLSSRHEVEAALASTSVPVTTFRAAMIIGSGSASFEILRYLVERLPIMITPRWVHTKCQPIAVRDVLHYLVACLDAPATRGQTLDIAGPDIVSYLDLIQRAAELRGLRRRIVIPLPVLTPRLSSLWIHLVTPIDARLARPLAEGLRNEVIQRDRRVDALMPHSCMTVDAALRATLDKYDRNLVETRFSDAGSMPGDPNWAGGTVFHDPRSTEIDAPPSAVFRAVCRVGGGHGWYAGNFLWKLRGFLDKLVGGPGLRRGRRHPESVSVGEALDFWRVTEVEEPRRLELRAEMKLPGVAMLEFEIEPSGDRGARLTQTARFKPKGLLGLAYWYSVLPLHGYVFRGMLRGIDRAARKIASEDVEPSGSSPA